MESKVKELLESEKAVYCFDVDGVLALLEFGENNHYCNVSDEVWASNLLINNYYNDKKVNKVIQRFLKSKDMRRVYVITKVFNEVEFKQKKDFVFKNFNISPDNVFMVNDGSSKLKVMRDIHKSYCDLEDKYMNMIDDTVNILNNIMNNSSYSTVHVSSFFSDI